MKRTKELQELAATLGANPRDSQATILATAERTIRSLRADVNQQKQATEGTLRNLKDNEQRDAETIAALKKALGESTEGLIAEILEAATAPFAWHSRRIGVLVTRSFADRWQVFVVANTMAAEPLASSGDYDSRALNQALASILKKRPVKQDADVGVAPLAAQWVVEIRPRNADDQRVRREGPMPTAEVLARYLAEQRRIDQKNFFVRIVPAQEAATP